MVLGAGFGLLAAGCSDDPSSGADTADTASDVLFDTGGNDATGTPDTTPADTTPADTNPPDTRPVDTSPPDSGPGDDTEPADTEPVDTEPADTEPADTEPADTEPADTGPSDTGPADTGDDTGDTVADTSDTADGDDVADTSDAGDDTVDDTNDAGDDTAGDTSGDTDDTDDTDTGCVPECTEGLCGDEDGCGELCGCADGEVCSAFGTCEDEVETGNTCDAPRSLVADGDDLVGEGDLFAFGVSDQVVTGTCPLLGEDSVEADGVGTPDEVWTFSVPEDGNYTIEVTSDLDADVFYMLFEGPGCEDAACQGYVDNAEDGGTDTFDHTLSASATYTLVIDTWAVFSAGPYAIRVSPACTPQCVAGACGGDDGCGGECGCGVGEVCEEGVCLDDTGDTCLSPYMMVADEDDGSFAEIGNLAVDAVDDDYSVEDCPLIDGVENDGVGTPDEVFTFEIVDEGIYTIDVLSDEGADVFFALYEGDLCQDGATCVGQVDNGGDGDIDGWIFGLTAGTYTLVVDTYDVEAVGAYLVFIEPVAQVCAPDLFFSEYVESGEGTTKLLEIYNGTGADVDLAGYEVWRANNGTSVTAAGEFALEDAGGDSPILGDGETWVICHGQSAAEFLALCDQDAGSTLLANFNGNDYIGLVKLGEPPVVIDAIGVEGEDPGDAGWLVDDGATVDHVVWRAAEVSQGNPDWDAAVAAEEWLTLPAGTLEETLENAAIGSHDVRWICLEAP